MLTGNDGDNRIRGRGGNDTIDGGAGFDIADYRTAPAAVSIFLADSGATTAGDGQGGTDSLINIEGLRGSDFNDNLGGNSGSNLLEGRDGDDSLGGGAGNDTLDGGSGFDYAIYQYLQDSNGYTLTFNQVAGTLEVDGKGPNGAYNEIDRLTSVEAIVGSNGPDTIVDKIAGRNTYMGGYFGNDTIIGNAGDTDFATYIDRDSRYQVNADLGTGVVTVTSALDANYLETDKLINIRGIWTGGGSDSLLGSAADEAFRPNGGSDTIDGGAGTDWVDYRNSPFVTVRLAQSGDTIVADNVDGTDILRNIEGVSGSLGSDVLIGNDGDNWLRGRAGSDSIDGGAGIDTINHATASSPVEADLVTGEVRDGEGGTDIVIGIENITGGDYNDTLRGGAGANRLDGGDGNDTLMGREGNDTLIGGSGFNYADYTYLLDANGYNFTTTATSMAVTGKGNNSAYNETDTLSQIDRFYLSNGSDTVTDLWAGHNTFMQGRGGNDTITGNVEDTDFSIYWDRPGNIQVNANLSVGAAIVTDLNNNLYSETDTLVNINGVFGGAGNDTLIGNALGNYFSGREGNDSIDGGAGNDWAGFDAARQPINVHMAEAGIAFTVNDGYGSVDTLVNIEHIDGTAYDDLLVGNSSDNGFRGRAGFDTIDGGPGQDFADYFRSPAGINVTLADSGTTLVADGYGTTDSLTNIEGIFGTDFNDTLVGNAQDNLFRGYIGNDSIDGKGGNDTVNYGNAGAISITLAAPGLVTLASDGEGGTDTLRNIESISASNFADRLVGNAADNRLSGQMGNDTIVGSAGNDTLFGGNNGETGMGDMLDYSPMGSAVVLNLVTGVAQVGGFTQNVSGFEFVLGSAFSDQITGNVQANGDGIGFSGGGGNDTITGGASLSDYVLYANATGPVSVNLGTGVVSGADGNDRLSGIELALGSAYNDTLVGSDADNTFIGGLGNDSIDGGAGIDQVSYERPDNGSASGPVRVNLLLGTAGGADGNDTLVRIENVVGSFFGDQLIGDDGPNLIFGDHSQDSYLQDLQPGANSTDTLAAAAGDDSIIGGGGADTLVGQGGNDLLDGGLGADLLFGGGGDDTLMASSGNDTLSGGTSMDDNDVLDYSQMGSAVVLNLVTGVAQTGGFTQSVSQFENVVGTAFNDLITGNMLSNGNGIGFAGGLGNDTIVGGASSDDAVIYLGASGSVSVNLATGAVTGADGNDLLSGIENAIGSAFDDTIIGSADNNNMVGGQGNDSLIGGAGTDTVLYLRPFGGSADGPVIVNLRTGLVSGADGNDTLVGFENIVGSAFDDVLIGDDGNNVISGGRGESDGGGATGNDTILGGGGNDELHGYDGADLVSGGSGNDTLYGGQGNDTLVGGDGRDIASFHGNFTEYTITYNAQTGQTTITDLVDGRDGTDLLSGVESFQFADAVTPLSVNPKGTYLTPFDPPAAAPTSLLLATIGAQPGDIIALTRVGAFQGSPIFPDDNAGMNAVFTGPNGFIAPLVFDSVTPPWYGGPDMPQDFEVAPGVTLVQVPAGATGLQFSPNDNYFADNTDPNGDYGVMVRKAGANLSLAGNDMILGTAGNDSLRGAEGGDTFVGGWGNDTIDGGAITDRADYSYEDGNDVKYSSSMGPVNVNLSGITGDGGVGFGVAQDGMGGVDRLININFVTGSAYNDTIVGSSALWLEGFNGGAGDDSLDGGAITDLVNFSNPNLVSYDSAGAGVTVNLTLGTATGGAGNDTLANFNAVEGSSYNDSLVGSDVTTWIEHFVGQAGNDTIDGRGGIDKAWYDNSPAAVNVNLATGAATDGYGGTDSLLNIEQVRGSDWNDTLSGDGNANLLEGGAGNDNLTGGDGNDTLLGGAGGDNLTGGVGNDSMDGGVVLDRSGYTDANSVSYAGSTAGVNVDLSGVTGDGSVGFGTATDGLGGSDTLRNINVVTGSPYADHITGSGANFLEQFLGGAGNDTIDGGPINAANNFAINRVVYVNAPSGVTVDLGTGLVSGGDGNDVLSNITHVRGSAFGDVLTGSNTTAYTESLEGRGGNDTIDGMGGIDEARYDFTSTGLGVFVDLPNHTAQDGIYLTGSSGPVGTDSLVNIENVRGSDNADTLIGDGADNSLNGRGGNDSIFGGVGKDSLTGGAGNDTLDGGAILDRIRYVDNNFSSYNGATSAVNIDLRGISGDGSVGFGTVQDGQGGIDSLHNIDILRGSTFDDTITGSTALWFEQFEGDLGNDTIDGGVITDTLNLDNSNRASYQGAPGAVFVSLLSGTSSGAAGNDTLYNINQLRGSDFNDTLTGSDDSVITETFEGRAGNDSIDGRGGNDQVRYDDAPAPINVNLVTGIAQDGYGTTDTLSGIEGVRGSAFNDVITGGYALNGSKDSRDGFEFFRGEGGNDTIDGGVGYDRVDYNDSTSAVVVNLGGGPGGSGSALDGLINPGTGLAGTDLLLNIEGVRGSLFNDSLLGTNGGSFESFEGMAGNDTVDGMGGTDRADYRLAHAGVTVNLLTGVALDGEGGTDQLSNIEDVRGSFYGNDSITGSSADNLLEGLGGNDTLVGGDGKDTLDGGDGNDSLDGGLSDDLLLGGTGNDTLHGGAGQDSMDGGKGTDVALLDGPQSDYLAPAIKLQDKTGQGYYEIRHVGGGNQHIDVIRVETVKFGDGTQIDLAPLGVTVTGAEGVDNLLDGSDNNDSITGLSGNDALDGQEGNDTLTGGDGNDTVDGGDGQDTLLGGNGQDTLDGGDQNDTLSGGAGADTLQGGVGADTMSGGSGADEYFVDDPLDQVIEADNNAEALPGQIGQLNLGSTIDKVTASINYTLGAFLENLTLKAGTAALVGVGNALNNLMIGNEGNNTLTGAAGNDTLDGSTGADSMVGGTGNDVYYVDNVGDTVLETDNAAEGALPGSLSLGSNIDKVVASVNATLGKFVENLDLAAGKGNLSGTGNELANVITGNEGNNVLTGGAGNDTFVFAASGNGVDLITDFAMGDVIQVAGANFSGVASLGNGAAVLANKVQIATSGGNTLLYIGTDAAPGFDTQIQIAGVHGVADFALAGNQISLRENHAPTGAITLQGSAAPGGTLSILSTVADADGLGALHYQWLVNGNPIPGATGTTLSLGDADQDKTFSMQLSYTDSGGMDESVLSSSVLVTNGKSVQFIAYSWNAHTLLGGVTINGASQVSNTDASGTASLAGIMVASLPVTASRAIPGAESASASSAVNVQDAIDILKMVVGLEVNGPDKPLSPYQTLAADFDGNGAINVNDAIGVLKHVVGLAGPEPTWRFVDELNAAVPSKTGLNPGQSPSIEPGISGPSPVKLALVGYLTGDVDGSFQAPGSAQDLDVTQPDYFNQLFDHHPELNPAQFGIYP